MARLADDVIEQIKRDVSLVRLIESQGYKLTKHGKDLSLSCPFHDDKTASLVVTPSKNLYHCFGCDTGGSVIDWAMKTQHLAFREAVTWLGNDCFVFGEPVEAQAEPQPLFSLAAISDNDKASDQALLQRVIGFYHEALKQSPEAMEYLASRGLDDPELIDVFKLGYANRTLGLSLPEKNRKAGAEIRRQLQRIGLYRDSGHEHFNGSLVMPVMNQRGEVTEVYGRKILSNLRKGTPKHLYLPGPHVGIFNPVCLVESEIILCESLIDAMTFWRHGFKNVTTSYGTSGFTDELFNALQPYSNQRVLIAYDRDDAGDKAAEKVAERLMGVGIDCYRIQFPKGMDANEYTLQVTPAAKSLGLVIDKAEWMGIGDEPQSIGGPLVVELPVVPESEAKPPVIEAVVSEDGIKITLGSRWYRVRGLQKNMSHEQLKVNLLVSLGDTMHVDQLDLYNAKARQSFIKQAAIELGVTDTEIKKDLGLVLLKLESLQDEQIRNTLEKQAETSIQLSDEEETQALELLRDPSLLSRLLKDFDRCGVVGEETNKLVGYLACVSRKLDKPLAIIIQSTSAAGKSSLMDAVLAMVPEEERIQYSAMTGQSLFYMGETNLKHKILAIAEEEGASSASYALKLLQSEGEVSIASTSKNETTGNLETKSYKVQGPVMLFLTTTAIDIDEELMNRCLVLTVNESREQTEAIHVLQRKSQTLEGLLQRENKKQLVALHQNAQRLLKSLKVVNPFAEQLTFLSDKTRTRRDHMKYLQLINSITLLHQYQRKIKTVTVQGEVIEYIEVTLADIEQANRLAHDVLGRSLDELPPQTRKLLQHIHEMVKVACQQMKFKHKDYRFSRKDIRAYSGWTDNQLKVHCHRLEELEYLLIHRGSRGQSLHYELLFDGDSELTQKHVMGLLEVDSLRKQGYGNQKLGLSESKLVPSFPQVGGVLGPSWSEENGGSPMAAGLSVAEGKNDSKSTYSAEKISIPSRNRTDASSLATSSLPVNQTEAIN